MQRFPDSEGESRQILIVGPAGPTRDAYRDELLLQKMSVTTAEDVSGVRTSTADVVVLDAGRQSEPELDAVLSTLEVSAPLLVIHAPPGHQETAFAKRRPALLEAGAADTMLSDGDCAELVLRVRALLLRNRRHKVLILEDEQDIAAWVAAELQKDGAQTAIVETIDEAREIFESEPVDALLIDRLLPGGTDGLNFLRELRARGIRTPALIYTALKELSNWIEGRETGADDYVGKPVEADELRARLRFVLLPKEQSDTMIFGPLEIVKSQSIVRWRGQIVPMSEKALGGRTQFDLLVYLAERAGHAIPFRMLIQDLWHRSYDDTEPLKAAKLRLVKKLREGGVPDVITAEGSAYRFDIAPLLALSTQEEDA